MAETYPKVAMTQGSSSDYAQDGLHQSQQSYQQGDNYLQNQGQNSNQVHNFNNGASFHGNEYGQTQNYTQSQNSYQRPNTASNGPPDYNYGTSSQQQSHMTNENVGQHYGQQVPNSYQTGNNATNEGQTYHGGVQQSSMYNNQGQAYPQNSYQGANNPTNQGESYNGGNQQQQHMNNQGQGYQQGNTSGMNGQAGQSGAQYPDSKAPDTIHIWLDRIEKKFGGERFDETKHPENIAKNKALNENIIKKLTQVMKIVMQRGPKLAMQYGSKLF